VFAQQATVVIERALLHEQLNRRHGVDPDIPVEDDPARLAGGTDPQRQRAIEEVTKRVAAQPKP
jgi:C-terminal processing protease CtpA/Prc